MSVKEKIADFVSRRRPPRITDDMYEEKMVTRRADYNGGEVPDSTPMAPPVGFVQQPSLVDQIRNMVRSEMLARAAESDGFETFDEADDFDIEDDLEPASGYENDAEFEPPAPPAEPEAPAPEKAAEPPSDGPEASTPPDA